jgi:predicted nucleic acid-binding protein
MTAYLDTSSLVKLYVDEPDSPAVLDLVTRATTLTTSAVAYAEARAAFARLRKTRSISPAAAAKAVGQLDVDWSGYVAIDVTRDVSVRAGRLADRFGLRGFDAIHLASFELVLERADDDVAFSSADATLSKAATRLG